MKEVLLGTDVVLNAMIGKEDELVERLIGKAERGEIQLTIAQLSLYWALFSVQDGDQFNARRFARLLKYAQLLPDSPEYLGPSDRESWTPSGEEVENWRACALRVQPDQN